MYEALYKVSCEIGVARWTSYLKETRLFDDEDLALAFIGGHKLTGVSVKCVTTHVSFDALDLSYD